MNLSVETSYPVARRYVLKLHRDAVPAAGRFIGQLENMVSGERLEFHSGEQLLALLAGDPRARAAAAAAEL